MPSVARAQADQHAQRTKLANSYNELFEEFHSKDLRTVGNYTLGRLIGKGSFGKVYLASHKLTNGSKVVLKSAKKDDSNLAREIHHHRQFLHPHIARLYEVIVTESLVWLVLEYCPGAELYDYLLKHGPLEPAKVQKIFTQLVGAVSYVHNKGCVHRDLKLENILMDKHENVKLVDFGFTREYEGKASYLQTWCGTVCYSAPEMLKGEKYAGEKVDVWSLGIILYALLAGELPYDDDEEMVTKTRILKEEPKYGDLIPQGAKELITALLSKRPLLRPSLKDILQNPWLAEHAPQQQEILKLQQPAPFSTDLEKETLERMRSAGVDIDMVIENVLAQRCDGLAGWWALLIEKEERKQRRRDRKRKEREAEAKSLRRLSAASKASKLGPAIRESEEEGISSPRIGPPPKSRGRNPKRTSVASSLRSDLPRLPEGEASSDNQPPPPIEKDRVRTSSSSRPRPPPKDNRRRSRGGSQLHIVVTNTELQSANGIAPKRRKKYQPPFLNQFATLKNWFEKTTKRGKSPGTKSANNSPKLGQSTSGTSQQRRPSTAGTDRRPSNALVQSNLERVEGYRPRPRISTNSSHGSGKRLASLSPSPVTPRASYRHNSGLRGRKSTSSSVSSVRSIHHHHSHSKASSTSSTSIVTSPASGSVKLSRSPHTSVKVLPATPTKTTFPSNIRVVRSGSAGEAASAFGGLPPPSPGLVFAKRKRSPFKGPMLNLATHANSSGSRARGDSGSRSGSVQGRASGEIIEEEDEDDVEEVDAFSPVTGPGEYVEESPEKEGGNPSEAFTVQEESEAESDSGVEPEAEKVEAAAAPEPPAKDDSKAVVEAEVT